MQAASLAAYSRFLLNASNAWLALAVVLMGGAVAWLLALFAADSRSVRRTPARGPLTLQAR